MRSLSNLFLLVGFVLMLASCSKKEDLLLTEPDGANIFIPASFTVYSITAAGTYVIKGTVNGEIIEINSEGNVIIKGEVGSNPIFNGKTYTGTHSNDQRSDSHIRGNIKSGTLTIKDFTFNGKVGHNFLSIDGDGSKTLSNLTVTNNTTSGAGAINAGANSMVKNCTLKPHDDAIKITEPNSRAYANKVELDGNGTCIQFGWGSRSSGAIHYADSTILTGYVKNNGQTDTDDGSGRAIVGGVFSNAVSDIQITKLKCNMSSLQNSHLVRLKATGATVSNIKVQGTINNYTPSSGIHKVALATSKVGTTNGKIDKITIDFAGAIKSTEVYKDAGVTNYTLK